MKKQLLASAVSVLCLGLCAGPAMADSSAPGVAGQLAEQVAGSQQTAHSNAQSTQINPTNTNISVRVLSPGDDGDVTQSNESGAVSFAGNSNDTAQSLSQSQGGGAGGVGIQEAAQQADNRQWADSNAESTQVHPTNKNISVRVLSEGDNGDVDQSNSSEAKSFAGNHNGLTQDLSQDQGGSTCRCDHGGGIGIQAGGQHAYNKQQAVSNAESKQIKPTNTNVSVRVLSEGDDGDVSQSNDSAAFSGAFNKNDTTQTLDQTQYGSDCGCSHGLGIQAGGQKAYNQQWADSNAESKQIHPENKALSVRFLSPNDGAEEKYAAKDGEDGGGLSQSNSSFAASLAANKNRLHQALTQTQGAS